MAPFVDKITIPPDSQVSPSAMYTQINDMITYVKGIADTNSIELASALDALDLSIDDFTYTAPTLPDDVVLSFDWTSGTYTSEMWATLYAKVHADITSGGRGISDAAYTAILARATEARRVSDEKSYRKGLDNVGARGFNLPSGQIAAMELEFARDQSAKNQDAINVLLIKDFDMATENTRFAITTAKELEAAASEAFNKAETVSLEAAKAAQEYVIQVYESAVKLFDAQWAAVNAESSAYVAKYSLLEKVAEARVSATVQAVASALGAINTSMSHGYNGSESEGVSWHYSKGISNSLSESHTYEEQAP